LLLFFGGFRGVAFVGRCRRFTGIVGCRFGFACVRIRFCFRGSVGLIVGVFILFFVAIIQSFVQLSDFGVQSAESGLEFLDRPIDLIQTVMLWMVLSPFAFLVNCTFHFFRLLAQPIRQITHAGMFEMADSGNEMFELVCRMFDFAVMVFVIPVVMFMVRVVMCVLMRAIVVAVLFLQLVGDFSDAIADVFQFVTSAGFLQLACMTAQFFEVPPQLVILAVALAVFLCRLVPVFGVFFIGVSVSFAPLRRFENFTGFAPLPRFTLLGDRCCSKPTQCSGKSHRCDNCEL
jgi:hypothetical protein